MGTASEDTKSLYKPPNTIRLLTFECDKIGSQWAYCGKLTRHIFTPDLEYNCVSYVWGQPESPDDPPKHAILLNGLPRRLLRSLYPILELIHEK
jgi:hypothetical protein